MSSTPPTRQLVQLRREMAEVEAQLQQANTRLVYAERQRDDFESRMARWRNARMWCGSHRDAWKKRALRAEAVWNGLAQMVAEYSVRLVVAQVETGNMTEAVKQVNAQLTASARAEEQLRAERVALIAKIAGLVNESAVNSDAEWRKVQERRVQEVVARNGELRIERQALEVKTEALEKFVEAKADELARLRTEHAALQAKGTAIRAEYADMQRRLTRSSDANMALAKENRQEREALTRMLQRAQDQIATRQGAAEPQLDNARNVIGTLSAAVNQVQAQNHELAQALDNLQLAWNRANAERVALRAERDDLDRRNNWWMNQSESAAAQHRLEMRHMEAERDKALTALAEMEAAKAHWKDEHDKALVAGKTTQEQLGEMTAERVAWRARVWELEHGRALAQQLQEDDQTAAAWNEMRAHVAELEGELATLRENDRLAFAPDSLRVWDVYSGTDGWFATPCPDRLGEFIASVNAKCAADAIAHSQ